MPSTVVHLAIATLLAAALLGDAFDRRSLAVVLAVVVVPDLDTFVGLVVPGTHRAALHTLLVPLALAALIVYDTRYRERSFLRRYGDQAVPVAWVAVVAYAFAGIGPDLFYNGVNPLYPLHDRFVALSGDVMLSNQRGLVQTIWEVGGQDSSVAGTTANTHYTTGVDPSRGAEPEDVERIFPIARGGLQVLLVVTAVVVGAVRLRLAGRE